jgi:hypothetical protein
MRGGERQGYRRAVSADRIESIDARPVDQSRELLMSDGTAADESKALDEIVDRLQERFPDTPRDTVLDAVEQARATLDAAKVRDFVPVLVEKEAKARLKGKR